ncbi:hypothetical protein LIER_25071 [Lithospermum erythrorhizon]|uniref:Reverse transcriptase domain-containing protein n=1 Tax=Lithospermum erythrorhizon TaxID=34254 RepID=A0AAV3R7P3_LITER
MVMGKSLGPDGLSIEFYKHHWEKIGRDIWEAFLYMFATGDIPSRVNATILSLIPKVDHLSNVRDYRPISCCNNLYISDSVLMLQEVVQGYHKENGVPKAVIKCCITRASFSLNLNGTLRGWFTSSRGLRQGDPISSYLFILVLEIFNGLMRKASGTPRYTFHSKCRELGITHLSFADDMILLVSANMDIFRVVKDTLSLFEFGDADGVFTHRSLWESLRHRPERVPWLMWLWSRNGIPRHEFTSWMLFHCKLPTRGILASWGMQVKTTCVFCSCEESQDHLFFHCVFSAQVWRLILQRLGMCIGVSTWQVERQWCIDNIGGRSFRTRLMQMSLMCTIYVIWQERNSRVFGGNPVSADFLFHKVLSIIHDRVCARRGIKKTKTN